MNLMTCETQIVIVLCRTPLSDAARENARGLITTDIDWERVFKIAAAFEVEPVFFSNLLSLRCSDVPDAVLGRAAVAERDARAFALSRTLLLLDLYGKLENAGVPVIVLKGPALGAMAYGDPSLRTFGDIDFLTTRELLPRARDVMLDIGYDRDYDPESEAALIAGDHALEFSGPGSKVELHCALVERHLRFNLGGDDLWREAIIISCAGAEIRVLDFPRLLLFVCAHGTKHEWVRVRWICDVAQVADRIDREGALKVVELSRNAHARRILSIGLRLARDIVGQPLSLFPPDAVGSEQDTASIFTDVRRRLGFGGATPRGGMWLDHVDSDAALLLFWVKSRERWIDRIASVARVLFVPTEKDRQMGSLGWMTRPVRLTVRIMRRALVA